MGSRTKKNCWWFSFNSRLYTKPWLNIEHKSLSNDWHKKWKINSRLTQRGAWYHRDFMIRLCMFAWDFITCIFSKCIKNRYWQFWTFFVHQTSKLKKQIKEIETNQHDIKLLKLLINRWWGSFCYYSPMSKWISLEFNCNVNAKHIYHPHVTSYKAINCLCMDCSYDLFLCLQSMFLCQSSADIGLFELTVSRPMIGQLLSILCSYWLIRRPEHFFNSGQLAIFSSFLSFIL